jgi:hypothetical protein
MGVSHNPLAELPENATGTAKHGQHDSVRGLDVPALCDALTWFSHIDFEDLTDTERHTIQFHAEHLAFSTLRAKCRILRGQLRPATVPDIPDLTPIAAELCRQFRAQKDLELAKECEVLR